MNKFILTIELLLIIWACFTMNQITVLYNQNILLVDMVMGGKK